MAAPISPETIDYLDRLAAEWLRQDKDGETRLQIINLVKQKNVKELEARLSTSK